LNPGSAHPRASETRESTLGLWSFLLVFRAEWIGITQPSVDVSILVLLLDYDLSLRNEIILINLMGEVALTRFPLRKIEHTGGNLYIGLTGGNKNERDIELSLEKLCLRQERMVLLQPP
jgi:hypothetical protein